MSSKEGMKEKGVLEKYDERESILMNYLKKLSKTLK